MPQWQSREEGGKAGRREEAKTIVRFVSLRFPLLGGQPPADRTGQTPLFLWQTLPCSREFFVCLSQCTKGAQTVCLGRRMAPASARLALLVCSLAPLAKKKRYGKEIVDVSPDGRAGGRARPSLELLSFQPELPGPLVGLCMFPPPCCCKGETNCSSMAGLIACSTRCCSGPGCLRRLRPGVSQLSLFSPLA